MRIFVQPLLLPCKSRCEVMIWHCWCRSKLLYVYKFENIVTHKSPKSPNSYRSRVFHPRAIRLFFSFGDSSAPIIMIPAVLTARNTKNLAGEQKQKKKNRENHDTNEGNKGNKVYKIYNCNDWVCLCVIKYPVSSIHPRSPYIVANTWLLPPPSM
jgi:hypothetical protein